MRVKNEHLYINIKNTMVQELTVSDNQFISSKGEGHGYGMGIIERIAKKHDGDLRIKTADGWFESEVSLYIGQKSI